MHNVRLHRFAFSNFPLKQAVMCNCLSIFIFSLRTLWRQIYASLTPRIAPADHVQLLNAVSTRNLRSQSYQQLMKARGIASLRGDDSSSVSVGDDGLSITVGPTETKDAVRNIKQRKKVGNMLPGHTASSHQPNALKTVASMFTQRGQKGVNQDAMLLIEDFASRAGTIFCGVFDGHGPHGHLITRSVVDALPTKLATCWKSNSVKKESFHNTFEDFVADRDVVGPWKTSIVEAYKLMDRELIESNRATCISSGTTAVTLIKQGHDVILGNVGDSRAILGSMTENGSLVATQLTVDLKPDLPGEAERVRRLNGRVFALVNEPDVQRVWLPHLNLPGLAMTRALGDYCLKGYGVISEPEVTHWRLTRNDKFIVLATDGVWDVLSNEEVVKTVATTPVRSRAGKAVVDAAVHAWKTKHSGSKVDDCAVVCLFLDSLTDPTEF